MLYDISSTDLSFYQTKIDKQIDFLKSQSFKTPNGEFKSYHDVSMSANISTRYYAQLVNKVNTLQLAMQNEDLTPIFGTITLTGVFHALLQKDYRRFIKYFNDKSFQKTKQGQEIKKALTKLPNNDENGYLKDKLKRILAREHCPALNKLLKGTPSERFTISDMYQILRFQWTGLQKSHYWTKMKNEGYKISYAFVTEPHKSGLPHAHFLLYLPESYKMQIMEAFTRYCWASRNIGQSKKRLSLTQIKNGEINGFQWTLSNPVGYVMKYCTKSFIDIQNGGKLDELQAWYVKHKIRRITMSHTLIPQWVYNKAYPLESDWFYLTQMKFDKTCEWSKEDNYFCLRDDNINKTLIFDNGLYQRYENGVLVEEFGKKRVTLSNIVTINNIDFQPLSYRFSKYNNLFTIQFLSKHVKNALAVLEFNKKYPDGKPIQKKSIKPTFNNVKIVIDGIEKPLYKKQPYQMTHSELYQYYYSLNVLETNPLHFIVTQNEMIDRGLLSGKKQSLNIDDIFDTPKSSLLLYTKVAIQHHNAYQAVQTVLNSSCKSFKYDLFTKDFHDNYKRLHFLGLKKTKKEVVEVIPNKYPTLFDVA